MTESILYKIGKKMQGLITKYIVILKIKRGSVLNINFDVRYILIFKFLFCLSSLILYFFLITPQRINRNFMGEGNRLHSPWRKCTRND